jgi:hypothetical protein
VPGKQSLWTAYSAYVYKQIGKAGWGRILELVQQNSCCPGHFRGIMVDPYGGQIRASTQDTAFVHRNALFHFQILGYMVSEATRPQVEDWANTLYWALRGEGLVSTEAYQNYPNLNMSAVFREAYYGAGFDRLRAVKQKYDPDNVFGGFAFAV